jgi:hypothetical protein
VQEAVIADMKPLAARIEQIAAMRENTVLTYEWMLS